MQVDDLLKIPYQKNGRTLKGCDCWGFTVIAEKEIFDKNLPSWNIDEDFDIDNAKNYFIETSLPCNGDIVLMKSNYAIAHTGVFINERIYHMTFKGVVASKWQALKPTIIGYYKYNP